MASQHQPRMADQLPTLEEWQRFLKHLERQEKEMERLRQRNEGLQRQLEEALRAAKRRPHLFASLPRRIGRNPAGSLAPLTVARKVWGGNQTDGGAKTQQIFGSLFRTCWQQQRSGIETLRQLLCSRHPLPLPLLSADRSPPSSHSTQPNSGAHPPSPPQSHRCRSTP